MRIKKTNIGGAIKKIKIKREEEKEQKVWRICE